MSSELDDTISADSLESPASAVEGPGVVLPPGSRFAGRYRVEGKIGEGGMGAVYRVRDEKLDEVVALKLLTLGTERAVQRFLAEVRLARRVTHPNVARTHDLGEAEGVHFLTMEHVRGRPLDVVLEEEGALPAARVVALGVDIAKGLSAAHAAGVVHRDLKPANVLVAEDGRAVITDFGIARATGDDGAPERTGALLGTPAYMAPEQVRGAEVDARTDVYALGMMLYELLTDALPFEGETPIALAMARLQEPPVDPRARATVPDPLAHLVLRCLAVEPDDRPGSAADVRAALEGLAGRATSDEQLTAATSSSLYAPLTRADRTLAVLPFAYRGAEDHAYLGEGLAEELIDVLSRTRGMKVLTLGATRRYACDRDPAQVGAELGVEAVVDGTVQRSGDRVRLAVRLVDGGDGVQRWSDRFDGTVDDVFALQEKLARRVAEALRLELAGVGGAAHASPRAVELYLRARRQLRAEIMVDAERAVELLEEALALSPELGVAKAAHAIATLRAWWGNEILGAGPREERARQSVARALADAPELAETHLAEAMLATQTGGYREAAQALGRALEIAPTMAEAHSYLGGLQIEARPGSEGAERVQLALELDPTLTICHLGLARYALLRGDESRFARHDAALAEAFPPQHLPTLVSRLRWALYRDDAADARAHFETLRSLGTDSGARMTSLFGVALGEGELAEARAIFEGMPRWMDNPRFLSLMMQMAAEVFAVAGEPALAVEAVAGAADLTLIDVVWLDRCPLLTPLHADPGFEDARRRVAARAADIWR